MSQPIDWTKVSVRYAIIGVAGSLTVILGTYLMELFQVRVDLEKDAIVAHLSHTVESLGDAIRDHRPAAPETSWQDRETDLVDPPTDPDAAKSESPRPPPPPTPQQRYWGVVKNPQTPVYNRAGKHLRSIEAGTLVDVLAIRDTQEGQLAIGTLHYRGREVPDVLVKVRDLTLRRGTLATANERERQQRARHAHLAELIADRESELRRQLQSANPHAASYTKARSDYLAFARKAEDLTKMRDAASGGDRVKYADDLRKMLGEGVMLRNTYETAKRQYEDWTAARGGPPSLPHDDTLARLRSERTQLENELRALAQP